MHIPLVLFFSLFTRFIPKMFHVKQWVVLKSLVFYYRFDFSREIGLMDKREMFHVKLSALFQVL